MKKCPICDIELEKIQTRRGIFWQCTSCNGKAATLGFLRQNIPDFIVNQIWQKTRNIDAAGSKSCPSCGKKMFPVISISEENSDTLDVCKTCQLVWFDKGEFEVYPQKPLEKTIYDYLSPEEREELALTQMKLDRDLLEGKYLQDRDNGNIYRILLNIIFRFLRM